MVYLRTGSTFDYDTICKISGMLRQLATLEFVNIYYQNLNRCDPVYLFGDEIEYLVVNLDHSNSKARLLPIYPHISKFIENKHHLNPNNLKSVFHFLNSNEESTLKHTGCNRNELSFNIEDIGLEKTVVTPEYASYMVECIPDEPYSLFSSYVNNVRKSVHNRRKRLELILLMLGYNHSKVTTLTNFSRFGCDDYIYYGDSEFQKVFIDNLEPHYVPYFDICITPTNRMYDMLILYRLKHRRITTYISRYDEGFEESLEKDIDTSVNETLVDDYRGVPVSSRIIDTYNNYRLFPLLATHNHRLCQHLLDTYTESGKPATLTEVDEDADTELLKYIMGRVYLYDPKTDNSVYDLNVSNESSIIKAINVMSVKNNNEAKENTIGVESVGALCSLQVTFSCCNLEEARYLHDQLLVLAPIFISLSSATVGYNGILSNYDNRWAMMTSLWNEVPNMVYRRRFWKFYESAEAESEATAADTSTDQSKPGMNHFSKGRCCTSSLFISNSKFCVDNYKYLNDIKVDCDFDSFVHMTKMGVDPILARYVSHNFVYEPLTVPKEDFNAVNCQDSDAHYIIFHYTNWNSVRLNHPIPPPPVDGGDSNKYSPPSHRAPTTHKTNRNNNNEDTKLSTADASRSNASRTAGPSETIGIKPCRTLPWRVEFRPMDIQLTDEENSMFICVVAYLVKVLLLKRLNLYMPISLVDINTEISSKIESCHRDLFYFREDITSNKLSIKKFSLHDILFGQVGLFRIVVENLENEFVSGDVSREFRDQLVKYFKHFEQLTLGNTPTNATKLRRFIQTHPTYTGDGTITDQILYDIIQNLTSY